MHAATTESFREQAFDGVSGAVGRLSSMAKGWVALLTAGRDKDWQRITTTKQSETPQEIKRPSRGGMRKKAR